MLIVSVLLALILLAVGCTDKERERSTAEKAPATTVEQPEATTTSEPFQAEPGTFTAYPEAGRKVIGILDDMLYSVDAERGLTATDLTAATTTQLMSWSTDRLALDPANLSPMASDDVTINSTGAVAKVETVDLPDQGLQSGGCAIQLSIRERTGTDFAATRTVEVQRDALCAFPVVASSGPNFVILDKGADAATTGRAWIVAPDGRIVWTSTSSPLVQPPAPTGNPLGSNVSAGLVTGVDDTVVLWGSSDQYPAVDYSDPNSVLGALNPVSVTRVLVVRSGQPEAAWEVDGKSAANEVLFTSCGAVCISTGAELWDLTTRTVQPLPEPLRVLYGPPLSVSDGFIIDGPKRVRHDGSVVWDLSGRATVTPGGLVTATNDSQLILLDPATGTEAETIPLEDVGAASAVNGDDQWVIFAEETRKGGGLWGYLRPQD